MQPFAQVTIHWVQPFDDSDAELTPLYLALVEELKDVVNQQDHVLNFGPFVSSEADHYHLSATDRRRFATQILDWFAGKTATQ